GDGAPPRGDTLGLLDEPAAPDVPLAALRGGPVPDDDLEVWCAHRSPLQSVVRFDQAEDLEELAGVVLVAGPAADEGGGFLLVLGRVVVLAGQGEGDLRGVGRYRPPPPGVSKWPSAQWKGPSAWTVAAVSTPHTRQNRNAWSTIASGGRSGVRRCRPVGTGQRRATRVSSDSRPVGPAASRAVRAAPPHPATGTGR